ncbi:hypothetical protein WUBG_16484 [Wuchereria bancrofti]|uniref:Uncharacterized protein n=1 Tax=Wuchereria bancrofti TaxID=6293 RepID=J9E6L6_WUCBA|nr:hypothetical protein WUBG_16484 [Wuchereria bancrofti]
MHYAAATRDGGHYVKILIKAGANSKAMDNEGHTPHYYGLNNVINLELLKETDNNDDNNVISENFPEQPTLHIDCCMKWRMTKSISSYC